LGSFNVVSIEPEGYCDLKRIVRNVGFIEIAVSELRARTVEGREQTAGEKDY